MTDEPFMHADVQQFLHGLSNGEARPQFGEAEPEIVRAGVREMFALFNQGGPELHAVTDIELEGGSGKTSARWYQPVPATDPQPCLIYFHGGGWVIGDLDSEDFKLRYLAEKSGINIISVDYVLAPEHPFPQPVQDCLACSRDVFQQAQDKGIDPDRIAIGGASAGANLALATACNLRDEGFRLAAMALFYGVYDLGYSTPSFDRFASGYMLEKASMEKFRDMYCPRPQDWRHPDASPLAASHQGLPSSWLGLAMVDPLADDSRLLSRALLDAGVPVELREYDGAIHGFTAFARAMQCGRVAIEDAAVFLNRQLQPGESQ